MLSLFERDVQPKKQKKLQIKKQGGQGGFLGGGERANRKDGLGEERIDRQWRATEFAVYLFQKEMSKANKLADRRSSLTRGEGMRFRARGLQIHGQVGLEEAGFFEVVIVAAGVGGE